MLGIISIQNSIIPLLTTKERIMRNRILHIILSYLIVTLFTGCTRTESPEDSEITLPVDLSINQKITTRALGDPTHSVNRILVLPFQKINPSFPDNNLNNFTPLYNFARQWDIATFPSGNLTLKLPKDFTYQVMVIGYNSGDFDFNNQASINNKFTIGSATTPTRLDNFHLYPKQPNVIPEFFTTFCTATNNGTSLGTTFTPSSNTNISLTGQLKRLVSGLTVQITGIPGYVKSLSLSAERMVKATRVSDTIPSLIQTTGDGESRLIQKLVPSNNKVLFSNLLLPTKSNYNTKLYLNVNYGSTTETYMIKVADSAISNGNSISLNPNHVVKIEGSYNKINLGFTLSYTINLDDNKWDGLQ